MAMRIAGAVAPTPASRHRINTACKYVKKSGEKRGDLCTCSDCFAGDTIEMH